MWVESGLRVEVLADRETDLDIQVWLVCNKGRAIEQLVQSMKEAS